MSGLRVLVVGASIAGPTTAYWLAKAGARVTVIERFQALRTGGQAIDIRTAGVSVMRKIPNMEAQVRAKSTQEEGVSFVHEDGRPYGTIRATGDPDRQSLISEYEIYRGDLARILYNISQTHRNVNYVFGEQIASMQQSTTADGPLKVEFANGLATSEYDLVVACDGATSRTRAIGFDCGVRDHIIPTSCWSAYFTINEDILHGSKISQGISAVGGRFISVTSDPSGSTRVLLTSVQYGDERDAAVTFNEASAKGDEELKEYVAQRFRGAGWKTDFLLEKMMGSEDFYASEIVQVKMPSLYNGRFVLVGDAGYAAGQTGGGTSLALAGAYILAGELSKHNRDLAAGLRGYEQRLKPIIKKLQRIPPFVNTILAPQTAWGIAIRNYAFAFISWTGIAEFIQKYLGSAFANTEAFPLPEYDGFTSSPGPTD